MNIKIDLKIFIFIIIFWLTRQIEIYALLMFFALIHECAHLITGIIVGFKPETIKISPYGFSINFKTTCGDYNTKIKKANLLSVKKIIIYSAGPIINLIIAIFAFMYWQISKYGSIFAIGIDTIIYSNILLFFFNLLPIYPLDGGRVIKEIVYLCNGLEKSYYMTNSISNITVVILTIAASFFILIYKNIAIIFIIGYLWTLIIINNENTRKMKEIWKTVKSD